LALELRAVGYGYPDVRQGRREAVRGLSLTVVPGRCTALVGATGSGKSTVVQLAAGLLRPQQGVVRIDGWDVWPRSRHDRHLRRRALPRLVGVVFQYPEAQFFEERVADEIAFGPRNLGRAEQEIPRLVEQALAWVGLPASFAERSPFHLSGGEMRRVALASVLACQPRYLLLDEPTAGLDAPSRATLLQLLRSFLRSGLGLLLVTHRMEEVVALADEVCVLAEGQVVASGTPASVFASAVPLEAWGLDAPATTKVLRRLAAGGVPVSLAALTVEEAVSTIRQAWGL